MKEYLVQDTPYMREYLIQNQIEFIPYSNYLVVKRRDDAHYFWLGVGYGQFCERKENIDKNLIPIAP